MRLLGLDIIQLQILIGLFCLSMVLIINNLIISLYTKDIKNNNTFHTIKHISSIFLVFVLIVSLMDFIVEIGRMQYKDYTYYLRLLLPLVIICDWINIVQIINKSKIIMIHILIILIKTILILGITPILGRIVLPFAKIEHIVVLLSITILIENLLYYLFKDKYYYTILNSITINTAMKNSKESILIANYHGKILVRNNSISELLSYLDISRYTNYFQILSRLSSLSTKNIVEIRNIQDYQLLFLNDGRIFKKTSYEATDVGLYHQLYLYDITTYYNTYRDLEENTRKSEGNLLQIKSMIEQIEAISIEKSKKIVRRKIHDIVGQRISLILLSIRNLIDGNDNTTSKNCISQLLDNISISIKKDNEYTSKELLSSMISTLKKINITLSIEGLDLLSEEITISLIKILREAVTNSIRHSNATTITCLIKLSDDRYFIEITDNGKIKPKKIILGNGLKGIKEEIENHNGILEIDLTKEFKLIITIPHSND